MQSQRFTYVRFAGYFFYGVAAKSDYVNRVKGHGT